MKNIQFDSGVVEYRINGGGVLRFNPGDPNVYARFAQAMDKVKALEKDLVEKAKAISPDDSGLAPVQLMAEADAQMKQTLGWVFGPGNDFDKLLEGVNLLAVAGNGERVVTNFFAALEPILVAGAEKCVKEKTGAAVAKAKARRAAQ